MTKREASIQEELAGGDVDETKKWHCACCGSTRVYKDAYVSMNDPEDIQTYDQAYCQGGCEAECEVELREPDEDDPEDE